ncbi:MAG: HD domain-containing protein [Planctomycetota bacterium]|nr:HD domain-containing protein [Planctomycetota bacterium]
MIALASAVREAGGCAYLVGGAVRDRLLGRPGRDADVEIHGLQPEVVETLVAAQGKVHLVGRQFAVLHVTTPEGELEVSLPRRESKTGPGHKGFAVHADPHLGPHEAARRRDFTVNAMLEDPLTGEVIDPYGGREDLRRGLLRHVSAAFAEDPLRVLRAGRFAARFGWRVHAETSALCRRLDLGELPRERIEREWQEILLNGAFPGQGVRVLEACGALRAFPELAALRGVPQDPVWHPEGDVLTHTALCLDAAVSLRDAMDDPWLEMLAVLCHDLGKANTTVFERGRWRSAMHDETGAPLTIALLARITERAGLAEAVAALVREHLRPGQLHLVRDQVGDSAIRRLATRVDLRALVRVAWADAAGRRMPMPQPWPAAEWLLARAESLGVRDAAPAPLLQGRDVLALGVPPGPRVGALLREAYESQLDGGLADRDQALAWLRAQIT